jgi:hypothetical protein
VVADVGHAQSSLHRPEAPSPLLHASSRAAGPPVYRGLADRPRADGRGSRRGSGLAPRHGRGRPDVR